MIFIKTTICLYAILVLIASFQEVKTKNENSAIMFFNIFFSIIMILSIFFMPFLIVKWTITLSLIGIQVVAILNGKKQHAFHLVHHIVRGIITLFLITCIFLF